MNSLLIVDSSPIPYRISAIVKNKKAKNVVPMLQEEAVPCQQCRAGMHRICSSPVAIPTLLSFVRGRKKPTSETVMCCDRKEFWTAQSYE